MSRFGVSLIILVLLFIALGVGIAGRLPGLMLAYLCAAPFVGILVGRASVRFAVGK